MSQLNILHMMQNSAPPQDFLFDGFLHGTVGSIVAAGGSGKSMLALQIAAQLAAGTTIANPLGLTFPKQRRVLYLPGEDPESVLWQRIHSVGKYYEQHEQQEIARNLAVFSLLGHDPDILDETWFNWLGDQSLNFDLVILDTLRRWHSADENDGGAMKQVITRLEIIARVAKCSVLFLHHANKMSGLAGKSDDQGASRGSSVLTDHVRWQGNLSKMTREEADKYGILHELRGKYVRLTGAKVNYGKPIDDYWLERQDGGVLRHVVLEKQGGGKDAKRAFK